jgi:hypothetical protein
VGLNAYVIPISAQLAGDYISLTIKLGGETLVRRRDTDVSKRWMKRVIPDDPMELKARALRVAEKREKARQAVAKIKEAVTKASGVTADWNESGGCAQEHPLWRECVQALREVAREADGLYPHLLDHSLKGYFVPISFSRPFSTEEMVLSHRIIDIGSTNALYEELQNLNKVLRVERKWDELIDGESLGTDSPSKVAYAVLESLVRKSLETQTPICFDE